MCSCGKEPETTLHYLLRCDFYSIYRLELLNDICALNHSLKNNSEKDLLKVLLYEEEEFSFKINSEILKCTIKFIKKNQIALVSHYFVFNSHYYPLINFTQIRQDAYRTVVLFVSFNIFFMDWYYVSIFHRSWKGST